MDEEQNTSEDMSTAESLNSANPLESLLATASGTSTHNVRNRQSTGSTVNDASFGLLPIYSSLDHRQHRTTHDEYTNQSFVNDSFRDDYEDNEESRVNIDSSGARIQVSNSRTYQTPFGPVRNSVGVQMRLGLGGLSFETNMSSSINSGYGRVFLFSSGRSSHSPFSPFGQTPNRYFPVGIFSSPFRGMFSPQMGSTSNRSEHFPFDNLNPQNENISSARDYNGPIITELSSDDDDDETDTTGDDKRQIEGKESTSEIDHLTINRYKTHERHKNHENITTKSSEDLQEFDTYGLTPNSSVTILNREDLDEKPPGTFFGLEESVVCDVTQSAQSKNENDKVEDKHTEPHENVDHNQSVLIDTSMDQEQIGKSSGLNASKIP